MDDVGLYMLRKSLTGSMNTLQRFIGRALLVAAPALMKTLAVVGTVAMFLVGGGILTHSIGFLHVITDWFTALIPDASLVMSILADGVVGIAAATSVLGASAFADDTQNNIVSHTDFIVESAMHDVKQNLDLGVTYDVLTASHTFEPEVEEANALVADITITPIEPISSDDNDA
ncbi:hypothetical protein TRIADDRAFT_62973 [Trichoplax adhaerens]|uniref:Uncharacterized protein n=1 Tax=Trichoplax adhaerens TaxID=10228 RepID=B3SFI5_TRIAD|nr:hypothetical protein TRIADDRAFT_62973 [Trichoplax adhaerens]EDV18510.1 hypothetical protein TRIADDRAFT_62973 [Trichoplax adhaerens]|eukprot:XP_002119004.1 hypothetical protein TRIADDRAFT_62973 [Trichoplax adhaerens]